ncbi:hypothetical protein CQW23_34932 [Capsicum baccatum]|uniref:Uncharacterized protein n=1 Tax=Capsicum baccatum TaxID=33114 RepID=A0A2G2UXG9_CAPBA|nr:hypothetical protein CQW23_34932 [Capsicum baccatum]
MHNISSLGSARSFSLNCNQMEDTNGEAGKDPLWNPELDFEDIVVDDETITLIYAPNKYTPPNEIGLGAMLLVSPTTTTQRSASPSPKKSRSPSLMAENYASFSMNVPVERLLVSPTTTEIPTSLSPVEDDDAYFSMNVPVEKTLVSVTTTIERSISPSSVAEDNATRSMNVLVENSYL